MKAIWMVLGALVGGAVTSTAVVVLAILWAWMLGDPALDLFSVYFFAATFGVWGAIGGGLVGSGVDL